MEYCAPKEMKVDFIYTLWCGMALPRPAQTLGSSQSSPFILDHNVCPSLEVRISHHMCWMLQNLSREAGSSFFSHSQLRGTQAADVLRNSSNSELSTLRGKGCWSYFLCLVFCHCQILKCGISSHIPEHFLLGFTIS